MRATATSISETVRANPRATDGFLALLLAGLALAYLATDAVGPGLTGASITLTLLQTLPLAWRRLAPLAVWVAILVPSAAWAALGYVDTAASMFAVPIALYTATARRGHRLGYAPAGATVLATVAAALVAGLAMSPVDLVARLATQAAGWILGEHQRARRDQVALLEERAALLEERAALLAERAARLERERETRVRQVVLEERARIARELHDVVAHHVSMIAIQAETGPYLAAAGQDRATEGFASIGTAARQALAEMRRLLGVLREERGTPPARAPQPGLADLDALLAEARRAGQAVELSVQGNPQPLPAGVDLSAYRIVQEALTNVRRHAGPARATVVVDYRADALRLGVTDDGCGANGPGAGGEGHGLVGMRERVAMLGGEFRAGPGGDGGFTVAASLPLAPRST